MDAILLEPTSTTPKVIIDPSVNKFEISGESRPENAAKFYTPIVGWFDNYKSVLYFQKNSFGKATAVSVDFKLEYFNSTSAKFILDIFYQLEKIKKDGFEVEVVWNYDKRDTDMKESGEEFSSYVPDLSVRYAEY
jgi:hypothetical protein